MQRSRFRGGVGLIVIMLLLLVLSWQNQQKLALYKQEINYIKLQVDILSQEQDKLIQEHSRLTKKLESFLNKWNVDVFEVTAYAPLDPRAKEGMCYSGDPRITASGAKVIPGVTAAAGSNIPYGTKIFIQGAGWRVVQDRGGLICSKDADIAMATQEEAFKWGRRKTIVVYERS